MASEQGSGTSPLLVLHKVAEILDCFSVAEPEPTLQQIIRQTGLPSSTCQRLVQNMVREGFLDRDGDQYRIGIGMVRWAAPEPWAWTSSSWSNPCCSNSAMRQVKAHVFTSGTERSVQWSQSQKRATW